MERSFILYSKPFSINSMYCSGRNIKTRAAKEWSSNILALLAEDSIQDALADLRDHFDPSLHCYHVDLKFYYPKEIFFNKSGEISSKSMDLSNVEKPLIDLLFLPKYFKEVPNLNIDDKYIVDLHSSKGPSNIHAIEVEIKIMSLKSG